MNMHIEIPSGVIYLDGHRVFRLRYKPFTIVNEKQVFLTADEKRLAKEMTKAFAPLIDKPQKTLED